MPWQTEMTAGSIAVVCAILQRADGKILIAQRPAGKAGAGQWEFPGGKVEAGEKAVAALVRELREELDLNVCGEIFQHLQRGQFGAYRLDVYRCRPKKALQPRPLEGQNLRWIAPADWPQYDFLDSNRQLWPLLLAQL